MAEVVITPRAERDIEEAIDYLSLPPDSWPRIVRSLEVLETFPSAGRQLRGQWSKARFILGPWSWMILIYRYDRDADRILVLTMSDGRSGGSPLSRQNS